MPDNIEDNEDPTYADSAEDFHLSLEELQTIQSIMTSLTHKRVRGRLRWLLSLTQTERDKKMAELYAEILYLENLNKFGSRAEFAKIMKKAFLQ